MEIQACKRNVDNEREKAYLNIIEILQDLQDNRATPFATRIVRDIAGHSYIRDNNEFMFLPPTFSKRQCRLKICYDSGWTPVWKDRSKCKFMPMGDWNPRKGFYLTKKEVAEHGGEVVETIVSWRSFRHIWQKKFPKLKVCAKGEDT